MTVVPPRFRLPSPLPDIVNTSRSPVHSVPRRSLHVAHHRALPTFLVPSIVARSPLDHVARCPAVVSFAFSIHQSSKRAPPPNVHHPYCIPHLPHLRVPTTTLNPASTAAHQRYIPVSVARLLQFTLSYLSSNDSSSLAPPPTIYAYGSILSPPRSSRHIRTSTILDEPPHVPIKSSHDLSCHSIRQDASLVSRT